MPPAGTDATTVETGWMKPVLQIMSFESMSVIPCYASEGLSDTQAM